MWATSIQATGSIRIVAVMPKSQRKAIPPPVRLVIRFQLA